MSARIRKDQSTANPVVTLGQNFTPEALKFFVRFFYEIGEIGRVRVETTLSGKVYIRWTSESWKDILSTVADYFSDLYGEKYKGFKKLATIHALKSQPDVVSIIEVIKLVYSLAKTGRDRKIVLSAKLSELGLPYDNDPEPQNVFTDNPNIPSFLFLFGFILGDGLFL